MIGILFQDYKNRFFRFIEIAVGHLVEALCYKPEGRWFDSRLGHWDFSLTYSFRPRCGPGVDSASNKNDYQEYLLGGKSSRCVRLTTLPHSYADLLEILGASNSWRSKDLSRPLNG
jgi:hypothetical protein